MTTLISAGTLALDLISYSSGHELIFPEVPISPANASSSQAGQDGGLQLELTVAAGVSGQSGSTPAMTPLATLAAAAASSGQTGTAVTTSIIQFLSPENASSAQAGSAGDPKTSLHIKTVTFSAKRPTVTFSGAAPTVTFTATRPTVTFANKS